MHPGCGIQLAYKILLDCGLDKPEKDEHGKPIHNPIRSTELITSPSTETHFLESGDILSVSNPAAAGNFCFMDDVTLMASMPELLNMEEGLIICVNTTGRIQFVRDFGMRGYAASASPAFYEDMVAKIKKAAKIPGLRFIEVIAPCPVIWHSDPSNTVEITHQAVGIGLWPLFEINRGAVTVTHKPQKLEAKNAFEGMQGFMKVDEKYLEAEWKRFLIKPYEARI